MSEIPFVRRLGDALEAAITTPAPAPRARRRRPRLRVLAVAAILTAGGGVAVAQVLSDPEELASNSIGCQDGPNSTTFVPAGDRTPIDACAQALREMGKRVPPLVACDTRIGSVAVLPGRGPEACTRAGFEPLPPTYPAARARFRALERALGALEKGADCLPPRELAARVQRVLRRSRWEGWRPSVRPGIRPGPCGWVSTVNADGARSVTAEGSFDNDNRKVIVQTGAPRSTTNLLNEYSGALLGESGQRCYSQTALREHVQRRLAPTGRRVEVTATRLEAGAELTDARQARLEAGCAVVIDMYAAADGQSIVVETSQRG